MELTKWTKTKKNNTYYLEESNFNLGLVLFCRFVYSLRLLWISFSFFCRFAPWTFGFFFFVSFVSTSDFGFGIIFFFFMFSFFLVLVFWFFFFFYSFSLL